MLLVEMATENATIADMNTTDYLGSMGKRLRIHREEMGLSQIDLVDRMRTYGVDVKSQHISGLERSGKSPSVQVLAAIARALETSTDYLLMLTDDPRPIDERDVAIAGFSPEADELARIVDGLPPFRRAEILAHAQMVEVMERDNQRDVAAALAQFDDQLTANGLVIGENGMRVLHAAMLDYAAALLGANATSAIASSAAGRGAGHGRAKALGK